MPQSKNLFKRILHVVAVFGIIIIVASAIYGSSFLAILGTSFIFWCSILFYITPAKHVPFSLLTATTSVTMSNIERILTEMDFDQKGVYLPPKNLKDYESSMLFVSKFSGQILPSSEEIQPSGLFNRSQDILFLTPPGVALLKIFEKQIGRSFTKVTQAKIQTILLNVIVEDLSFAENMSVTFQDDKVVIELKADIFAGDCQDVQKEFPRAHNAVGGLLSSSFACVLAKVTGRAIVVLTEAFDAGISRIEYQLMEEN